MSKAVHIGLDNIDHKVKKIYLGNNDISSKIKKGYIGDSTGKAKIFYSSAEHIWEKYSITTTEKNNGHGTGLKYYGYFFYTTIGVQQTVYLARGSGLNFLPAPGGVRFNSASMIPYTSSTGGSMTNESFSIGAGYYQLYQSNNYYSGTNYIIQGYSNTTLVCGQLYQGSGWVQCWSFGNNKSDSFTVYEYTNSRGSLLGTVESDNPSTYPSNGIHTDGYWYVKIT